MIYRTYCIKCNLSRFFKLFFTYLYVVNFIIMLKTESSISSKPGRCSITDLYSQPLLFCDRNFNIYINNILHIHTIAYTIPVCVCVWIIYIFMHIYTYMHTYREISGKHRIWAMSLWIFFLYPTTLIYIIFMLFVTGTIYGKYISTPHCQAAIYFLFFFFLHFY